MSRMSLWQKFRESLQFTESDELQSRRRALKGAASLALMAAIPVGVGEGYRLLTKREQAQLVHEIESGQVIEGRHFLLDRPIILRDINNVILRNCTFVCSPDFVGEHMMIMERCNGLVITGCSFQDDGAVSSVLQFKTASIAA